MLLQATVRAEQTALSAGVESQEGMAHPYRASSDQAEPLLPTCPSHSCTLSGTLRSLGQAGGQGHCTVLQILLEEGPLLAVPAMVLVLGSMSHDYTPVPPPMPCPPPTQAQVPPKVPLLYSTLARAAQLLTRQKGIATGGWGRKRHRLDARLSLGGQALSTRRGHMPAATAAD